MNKRRKSRFILWGRWFHRQDVVQSMEVFQDLIVILLCISLFFTMAIQLFGTFVALLHQVDFKRVTADILFLLILVELFRLLVVYLEEHSISVGVAVEVAIVSVLREVIVHGALEISWIQLLSICALLLILGALLMVCARTPHMDHFSYPFSPWLRPSDEARSPDSRHAESHYPESHYPESRHPEPHYPESHYPDSRNLDSRNLDSEI